MPLGRALQGWRVRAGICRRNPLDSGTLCAADQRRRAPCSTPAIGRSTAPHLAARINEKRCAEIGRGGRRRPGLQFNQCAARGHSPSESDVAAHADRHRRCRQGPCGDHHFCLPCRAHRLRRRAARRPGREVVLAGRAMRNTIEAARECGYLRDAGAFLEEEAFGYLPREQDHAALHRQPGRAPRRHRPDRRGPASRLALEEGDLVIFSSARSPAMRRMSRRSTTIWQALGVDVITADDALVHTSGHPRQGEFARFMNG